MYRFSLGKKVGPTSQCAVSIDREKSGQTPRDSRLLDLPPRGRRIPRQLANPILLFACVEDLCVWRVGIPPVADDHGCFSVSRFPFFVAYAASSYLSAADRLGPVYSLRPMTFETRAPSQNVKAPYELLSRELGGSQATRA